VAEYHALPMGAFLELIACHLIENGYAAKEATDGRDLDEIMIPV